MRITRLRSELCNSYKKNGVSLTAHFCGHAPRSNELVTFGVSEKMIHDEIIPAILDVIRPAVPVIPKYYEPRKKNRPKQ